MNRARNKRRRREEVEVDVLNASEHPITEHESERPVSQSRENLMKFDGTKVDDENTNEEDEEG